MLPRVYRKPGRLDEVTEFDVGVWKGDITVCVDNYHLFIIIGGGLWAPIIIGSHPFYIVTEDAPQQNHEGAYSSS